MMEKLQILPQKGNYFTPKVEFDPVKGECVIEGESYLEDAVSFYEPLISWVEEYVQDSSRSLNFKFRLSYFNTNSSRCILTIMKKLKAFEDAGGDVLVLWYFDPNDGDLLEEVDELSEDSGMDVHMVEKK